MSLADSPAYRHMVETDVVNDVTKTFSNNKIIVLDLNLAKFKSNCTVKSVTHNFQLSHVEKAHLSIFMWRYNIMSSQSVYLTWLSRRTLEFRQIQMTPTTKVFIKK